MSILVATLANGVSMVNSLLTGGSSPRPRAGAQKNSKQPDSSQQPERRMIVSP
jgi:hypothetical protein